MTPQFLVLSCFYMGALSMFLVFTVILIVQAILKDMNSRCENSIALAVMLVVSLILLVSTSFVFRAILQAY